MESKINIEKNEVLVCQQFNDLNCQTGSINRTHCQNNMMGDACNEMIKLIALTITLY